MKKLIGLVVMFNMLYGTVFAQNIPEVRDSDFSTGIVYFSTPYLAQDYKKCIFGTMESSRLNDEGIVDCEESLNPSDENLNRQVSPLLAKKIIAHWGNDDFFANDLNYFYQLDETSQKRSVYLWPSGPNWMTPIDNDRYDSYPFLIYLSVIDRTAGEIQSIPVISYENNKTNTLHFARLIKDFDLVLGQGNSLMVTIYNYKGTKRVKSKQYKITESGKLLKIQ